MVDGAVCRLRRHGLGGGRLAVLPGRLGVLAATVIVTIPDRSSGGGAGSGGPSATAVPVPSYSRIPPPAGTTGSLNVSLIRAGGPASSAPSAGVADSSTAWASAGVAVTSRAPMTSTPVSATLITVGSGNAGVVMPRARWHA